METTKRLIECVPNFSEGRNMSIIKEITDEIESVDGVLLLNVDPGEATNRTVVTFVGEPEPVVEAAFRAAKKAGEVIDMRQHHGAHPRMGATDVLPLIPVSGITLEECAVLARQLAQRLANEAGIPCYCYEAAALKPERKNLAVCRAGEYEALQEKLTDPSRKPDYMSPNSAILTLNSSVLRTGCTAVGARDFLIAVNWNLNTTSTRRANAIAFDVREKGRPMREGDVLTGAIIRDEKGNPVMKPGTLKCTKTIGWYIDEYGIAQVSMNMTNLNVTPLHVAFDEVCRCAQNRGIRVTGTEIVGLLPKKALVDAGKYFLEKQQRSVGIPEEDIIKIAIKSMGLDDLKPFNPREKVIEYLIEDAECATRHASPLVELSVNDFANETSRESPAPGGGSVAAYMGALGAALGTMVANLSAHKVGWDERWEEFSQYADMGQDMIRQLMMLVDEDTRAFNRIMEAFALPKTTNEEKAVREVAIQEATLYATQVPLRTMHAAMQIFVLCRTMAKEGNPNSVSDAGVGALAARAAVLGAGLNVKINAAQLKDKAAADRLVAEASDMIKRAEANEREIIAIVESKL